MSYLVGIVVGMVMLDVYSATAGNWLPKDEWHCTASHREGPEHDQHDVCDQYSRKDTK